MREMKQIKIVAVILLFVFGIVGLVFWLQLKSTTTEPVTYRVFLREVASIPILSESNQASASASPRASDLQITAQAAYIADLDSGAVLYKKNEHIQRSPASTTKLLTALVALETYDLDTVLTVSSEASTEGNVVGFYRGEQLAVRDLLKAMLINSGNDAAYMLANNHPQGYQAFMRRMNEVAGEIGMQSSHFENPAGFDADTHYSSAYDLYVLAVESIKHEVIRESVASSSATITNVQGTTRHYLPTTNQLLLENPQVVGIKTGTTEKAGQVLISQYQTDSAGDIIVVMMGSEDRFSDTRALADWVYSRYQWKLFSTGE